MPIMILPIAVSWQARTHSNSSMQRNAQPAHGPGPDGSHGRLSVEEHDLCRRQRSGCSGLPVLPMDAPE